MKSMDCGEALLVGCQTASVPDALIEVSLSEEERYVLNYGLIDWGGPSVCSEALARAMGFDGLDDLNHESERIAASIRAGKPLSARDWTRAVFSTEIIFASEVVGTGAS